MASRNIVIKSNIRCFKSALQQSLDFLFLVLYILADLISFLEIQRLQLAGSSSTVFAAKFTSPIPLLLPVDSDFRRSTRSGNDRECKQTLKNTRKHAPRVMTPLLMSANQHFTSTFLMQTFKFQHRRSCKLSFLFPSRRQSAAPQRACSQATSKSMKVNWP